MIFNETVLSSLREQIKPYVSEKRYNHILAVEELSTRLAEKIMPEMCFEVRAAALLHDIAKELSSEENIRLALEGGFMLTDEDRETVGILHSFSAPELIRQKFPEFATENILSAVMWHTVGRANMSDFEKIIFVADYAEHTRMFESCIRVRENLLLNFDSLSMEQAKTRLDEATLGAVIGAREALLRMGRHINSRMKATENYLKSNKL